MNDIYIIASGLWVVVSFIWLVVLSTGRRFLVTENDLAYSLHREIKNANEVRLPIKQPVPYYDHRYNLNSLKTHEEVSLQKAIDLIVEHCGIALEVTPATKETMKIVKKPRSKK